MLYISRSVVSTWTHLMHFHCSSIALSKNITEKLLVTFHDLQRPRRQKERSLITTFRFKVSMLHVSACLRVFSMVFVQKRHHSIFLPSWFKMERLQNIRDLTYSYQLFLIHSHSFSFFNSFLLLLLNILLLLDAITLRYSYYYSYQSLKISRQSLSRCSYHENSNFFWGEVTWRDLVTWSWAT